MILGKRSPPPYLSLVLDMVNESALSCSSILFYDNGIMEIFCLYFQHSTESLTSLRLLLELIVCNGPRER